ncbi:hemolysin [Xaviernesmea oryzae]|uniref:Hemolysin n=1 Tax=Xaviernesmea oryzae TaxID=464029 RepID=A0A1Q9ATC1_9HYPH|nr:calcium-binding protein [Xaviernesmea oryzae]OLP58626.1 hemolysin [Xaviernesmea oryzae]SEK64781.1 type I secretion C-terminal target domain (VC_A0849 subclass) [Xaviernesmea oryzae]
MATIEGTDFDDTIYQSDANLAAVTIYGYGGRDTITLDITDRDGGFNTVFAGTGNDKVINNFEGGNYIELGSGDDYYLADIKAYASKSFDKVYGGAGDDVFEVNGQVSDYFGGDGNDTFYSVGFKNYFDGGNGNDTISYEIQDEYSSAGLGVTVDLAKGKATITKGRVEILKNIENATGTASADDLFGNNKANVLKGLGGDDILKGFGGDDDLFGGSGDDDLFGGAGRDILVGGRGSDYLKGEAGADTFEFDSIDDSVVGKNRDVILDFKAKQGDLIDLKSIDADIYSSGDQSFSFIGAKSFSGEAGELRFSKGILSGDVDGDGRADFEIAVKGVTKMYVDDFVL